MSLWPPWNSGRYFVTGSLRRICALLEEPHDGGRGGDHFGERRGVEDRVERHWLAMRDQRPAAVGFLIDHVPVVPDHQNPPGIRPSWTACSICSIHRGRAREGFLSVQADGTIRARAGSSLQLAGDFVQNLCEFGVFRRNALGVVRGQIDRDAIVDVEPLRDDGPFSRWPAPRWP